MIKPVAILLLVLFMSTAFAGEQVHTFGVLNQRNPVLTAQYWNPILDYVSKKSGVEFAVHGKEAIDKYLAAKRLGSPFDFVILDLTIRAGMGGAETMRKLSEIDPGVKAVVSSGYSDAAVTSNYREQGFIAFFKKPYIVDELQEVLNMLLNS